MIAYRRTLYRSIFLSIPFPLFEFHHVFQLDLHGRSYILSYFHQFYCKNGSLHIHKCLLVWKKNICDEILQNQSNLQSQWSSKIYNWTKMFDDNGHSIWLCLEYFQVNQCKQAFGYSNLCCLSLLPCRISSFHREKILLYLDGKNIFVLHSVHTNDNIILFDVQYHKSCWPLLIF